MQAKFAKPPLPIKKPIPPNKRKDLGKVFLPTEFQIKAPFKILKTNIIKTQPPPKLKKPKILWKTLNKFTIKPKFIEFINYLRAICKNITNSLKESSIISQFLLNGKEEYLNAYEKLKALIDKFKHQKNSNLSILNEAKQQTMFLQSETKNLHHKLEEIKRLTIELKLKIQDKTIEKNQLSQENIIISQKHQDLFENSSNIKKDVLE